MKCRNCGGEVEAEALKCPYCGTKNPGGIRFLQIIRAKREQNKELEKEVLEASREGIINRVLNRTILVLAVVVVLVTGISFWIFFFSDGNHLMAPPDSEKVMQELYDQGEYFRLYTYMTDYDLTGQKYQEYSRIALLACNYQSFINARNQLLNQIQSGEMPESYHIEPVYERAYRCLYPTFTGESLSEAEQNYMEAYSPVIWDSLQALMGLDTEDLQRIRQCHEQGSTYLTTETEDYLMGKSEEYIQNAVETYAVKDGESK
ncbi:MAG: zinc ribbon domain-containing protein [bacterium]|nr:zinc ribbon domain-containing protein [bacterium]